MRGQASIVCAACLKSLSHNTVNTHTYTQTQFVVMGGSKNRMARFAEFIAREIGHLHQKREQLDISKIERFAFFKIGPVLSISVSNYMRMCAFFKIGPILCEVVCCTHICRHLISLWPWSHATICVCVCMCGHMCVCLFVCVCVGGGRGSPVNSLPLKLKGLYHIWLLALLLQSWDYFSSNLPLSTVPCRVLVACPQPEIGHDVGGHS